MKPKNYYKDFLRRNDPEIHFKKQFELFEIFYFRLNACFKISNLKRNTHRLKELLINRHFQHDSAGYEFRKWYIKDRKPELM